MYRTPGESQEVQYVYKFSRCRWAVSSRRRHLGADPAGQPDQRRDADQLRAGRSPPRATRGGSTSSAPTRCICRWRSTPILDPVINEWNTVQPEGARLFWTMRRARPLDASLPMGDSERRAMVIGWYIGQIVGEIEIPPEPYTTPVRIWDPSDRRWVSFPHPLLTPPSRFRIRPDWLPAVLESSLLAIAGGPPGADHVVPAAVPAAARAVRQRGADQPGGLGLMALAGQRRLAELAAHGTSSDRAEPDPCHRSCRHTGRTLRRRHRVAHRCPRPRRAGRQNFLPGGRTEDGKPGAYVRIDTRQASDHVPLIYDLAPDVALPRTPSSTCCTRRAACPTRPAPTPALEPGPATTARPVGLGRVLRRHSRTMSTTSPVPVPRPSDAPGACRAARTPGRRPRRAAGLVLSRPGTSFRLGADRPARAGRTATGRADPRRAGPTGHRRAPRRGAPARSDPAGDAGARAPRRSRRSPPTARIGSRV